jgi:hypothetical protein
LSPSYHWTNSRKAVLHGIQQGVERQDKELHILHGGTRAGEVQDVPPYWEGDCTDRLDHRSGQFDLDEAKGEAFDDNATEDDPDNDHEVLHRVHQCNMVEDDVNKDLRDDEEGDHAAHHAILEEDSVRHDQ